MSDINFTNMGQSIHASEFAIIVFGIVHNYVIIIYKKGGA